MGEPRRRNYRRPIIFCLTVFVLVTVIVGGLLAWMRQPSPPDAAVAYNQALAFDAAFVQIESHQPHDGQLRVIAVREPSTIVALVSMLDPDEEFHSTDQRIRRRGYRIRIPPPGVSSYSRDSIRVWQVDEGQFVWWNEGRSYRLNGDLDLFLKCTQAHRIGQLLTSHEPQDRIIGMELRDLRYQELRGALLALARSTNAQLQRYALTRLREFETKVDDLPAEAARDEEGLVQKASTPVELLEILEDCLATLEQDPQHNGAFSVALDIYRQFGAPEAPEVVGTVRKQLREFSDHPMTDELMLAAERIYGLPPSYERRGICGNSRPAAIRKFQDEQHKRRDQGLAKLLAWIDANGDAPEPARLRATIEAWLPRLHELATKHDRYDDSLPDQKLLNLLRLGPRLAPAARQMQEGTADLSDRGILGFVAAKVGGECDTKLVDELLSGDIHQQITGCQIIAVSERMDRERWTSQLARFIRVPLRTTPRGDLIDGAMHLRNAASRALFAIEGSCSIDEFRVAASEGFENAFAAKLLARYLVPQPLY